MNEADIPKYFFYKWRYGIGYGLIGLILISGLFFSSFFLPGGLSDTEMRAVVTSDAVSVTHLLGEAPLNAPYYLLQKASMALFGVTLLGVKLPSMIFGFLTAIGMIVLLRRWFSPGIALLASVVAVATGQFIFLAQHGAVGILYLFWPVTLLLLATLVARRARLGLLWKVLFFIVAALSLYTPLSIYVLIALGSAVLLHPHLRYIVKRLSKANMAIAALAGALLVVPLGWTIVQQPSIGLRLLGIPTSWPPLLENLQTLAGQYFDFISVGNGVLLTPVFGLGSMLLIVFGIYRLIRTRENVQSYVILTWLCLLVPVLVINPLFTSITFVPLLLLLATGLEGVLRSWYRLFPRNPYARVAGLVPIVILVSSLVLFGLERYAYAYHYAPEVVHNFKRDIVLLPAHTTHLKVAPDELAFYTVVAKHLPSLEVTTSTPSSSYVATRAAKTNELPTRVIVNTTTEAADRFYIYDK